MQCSFQPRDETFEQAERISRADDALAASPNDPDRIVEAALAREEVWRYEEAVELYTRGAVLAPGDYRMFLGRGHRLIRLRRLDEARLDLDRSFALDRYGFNTGYLRALVRYLSGEFESAAEEYARLMALAEDEDALALAARGMVPGDPRHAMRIATDPPTRMAVTAWRYRALRRAGRDKDAESLLVTVDEGVALDPPPPERYSGSIIRPDSNVHYYELLMFYRGLRQEEEVLDRKTLGAQWTTSAYGVAVWHLIEGREARAVELFTEIAAEPHWARLGHVAAEADLARLRGRPLPSSSR